MEQKAVDKALRIIRAMSKGFTFTDPRDGRTYGMGEEGGIAIRMTESVNGTVKGDVWLGVDWPFGVMFRWLGGLPEDVFFAASVFVTLNFDRHRNDRSYLDENG